ncbi:hypothetical protein IW262DRAFT_1416352 [Armillaria fumosa]|nr:hypothetical protein IW262DRAFT_1416352 [Armillaria fumosa]
MLRSLACCLTPSLDIGVLTVFVGITEAERNGSLNCIPSGHLGLCHCVNGPLHSCKEKDQDVRQRTWFGNGVVDAKRTESNYLS